MSENDDNMLADFGHTDSVFWKKRLAQKSWPPMEEPKQPEPSKVEEEVTYFEDDAGVLYRKEGGVYRKVGA